MEQLSTNKPKPGKRTRKGKGFSLFLNILMLIDIVGLIIFIYIFTKFGLNLLPSSSSITPVATTLQSLKTVIEPTIQDTLLVKKNILPNPPILRQPFENAKVDNQEVTLSVTVSDPDAEDVLSVVFFGRQTPPTSGADFSLVVIPDSQKESAYDPGMFTTQTQWIADNKDYLDIAFVTHVGDIVDDGNDEAQWVNARTAMDILDSAGIHYSLSPGNHDLRNATLFEEFFGISHFSGKDWYGGSFEGMNTSSYSLFSAGGMDFIVINLEYSPSNEVLAWADNLLGNEYPDRGGIVVQHNILDYDDDLQNPGSYEALRDNSNLFLMLCGHNHTSTDGAAYYAGTGTDGHIIHIVLQDYQEFNRGDGWLRIYRFSPAENLIHMTTFSPYSGESLTIYPDQMELPYRMVGEEESFFLIGSVENLASGDSATVTWTGLRDGTEYEWYATVSDGKDPVTGLIWMFRTGE